MAQREEESVQLAKTIEATYDKVSTAVLRVNYEQQMTQGNRKEIQLKYDLYVAYWELITRTKKKLILFSPRFMVIPSLPSRTVNNPSSPYNS